jgi:purine-binding chemotaxis protein CheW
VTLLATFTVAGTRFGVPAAAVREVVRSARITPVPHAPALLVGLVNLRGRIVPVYSLSQRLGLPDRSDAEQVVVVLDVGEPMAVAVEEYHEVVDTASATRSEVPAGGELARCAAGVWLFDEVLVCELDLGAALAP